MNIQNKTGKGITMSKLIIWDWDNTLADTRKAVWAGLQDLVRFYNLPDITEADVLNVMTSHRGNFWQQRFGENIPQAVEFYVQAYRQHTDLVQPFPQALELLTAVQEKNIPQVILSNKNEPALLEEVEKQGLISYFSMIKGTVDFLGKPDVNFVKPILEKFSPKQVILIGDGISDMLMAQNIGAISILVHQPNRNLPHTYYAETLSDVQKYLESLLNEGINE